MRFGQTLQKSIFRPWADQYIDYGKLKRLLRDSGSGDGSPTIANDEDEWTDEDEGAFVEELVNVQLEKVHSFQSETSQKLRDRTSSCEARLDPLAIPPEDDGHQNDSGTDRGTDAEQKRPEISPEEREKILKEVLAELDDITKETNELEKYSRINYTGFLKAAKKHDRKRGHAYRVRPLLQVRLGALPFNKEDYSPLLYRLSAMYSFVRQNLNSKEARMSAFSDSQSGGETFTSYKFWVHPENLLEVKTVILRNLPVLVYNPQTSKVVEGTQQDPTITSIYFDNPTFALYTKKVSHEPDASSLRLRWYGQLSQKPDIFLEKKTMRDDDTSEEKRFSIKGKYVQSFIKGEYKMEKSVQKLQERHGIDSDELRQFKSSVDDIQSFIMENNLQPAVRASYTRTAFQIPGDDRVRVSIDTDLAFIREDAFDTDRPCRDPEDWHRSDIDDNNMEYPFSAIRKGEVNRLPFAVLEVKIKGVRKYEWVTDLMNSHLVKEAPRFSRFVHGVAVLFEDYVNTFPFWLSELDTDIRKDPQIAFEEEQQKKAKAAEDEIAVGSLLNVRPSPPFKRAMTSPYGSPAAGALSQPARHERATAEMTRYVSQTSVKQSVQDKSVVDEDDSDDDGDQADRQKQQATSSSGLRSLMSRFSSSKYAQAKLRRQRELPPGVKEPLTWIKDSGPVRVEAKVWLANQRTFVKWQHVSVLLASLSLGLYNAAGANNNIARSLALAYTGVAVFAGVWGWSMYMYRSRLIEQRSGKDLDQSLGPIVVCLGLIIALCLNFGFKYRASMRERLDEDPLDETFQYQGGEL